MQPAGLTPTQVLLQAGIRNGSVERSTDLDLVVTEVRHKLEIAASALT